MKGGQAGRTAPFAHPARLLSFLHLLVAGIAGDQVVGSGIFSWEQRPLTGLLACASSHSSPLAGEGWGEGLSGHDE